MTAFRSMEPAGTMRQKEPLMIDLTEEQRKSRQDGQPVHVRDNGHRYVLLRSDMYQRLAEGEYDDGPWTAAELDSLREEAVAMLDRYGKDA
jgi:hypothetical protein